MKKLYSIIAFVFFIIMVAGISWAFVLYTEPVNETIQVVDYSYSYGGTYNLSAEVIFDNPVYERGTVLSDMAGYFYTISPVADIEYLFSYSPTLQDSMVQVDTETILRIQSLNDENTPYWTKELPLSTSSFSLEGSSSGSDEIVLDAADIYSSTVEIEETVGTSSGRIIGYVVTTANMEGYISSTEINLQTISTLPVYFRSEYYYPDLENASSSIETKNFYSISEVERNRDIMDLWMQLAIIAVGFIVFIYAVAMGRSKGEYGHSEFKDWISDGSFPGGDWDKEIYIPVLKDLVDIAIDTGKRVIYDKEENIFFVIDGSTLYFLLIDEKED